MGQASHGGTACKSFKDSCKSAGVGCLTIQLKNRNTMCSRKLCPEINQIMPDLAVKMNLTFMQNLSSDMCSSEIGTFKIEMLRNLFIVSSIIVIIVKNYFLFVHSSSNVFFVKNTFQTNPNNVH